MKRRKKLYVCVCVSYAKNRNQRNEIFKLCTNLELFIEFNFNLFVLNNNGRYQRKCVYV